MSTVSEAGAGLETPAPAPATLDVALLTGCQDRPYAFGLAMALVSQGVCLDVIGSDEVDSAEFHSTPKLRFLNLRGSQHRESGLWQKLRGWLIYYTRLIRYAANARPKIFHILWNNKFEYFDRTLLLLYFRLQGIQIALTAHNVNQKRRDANDSFLNRMTLRIQYHLTSHIFVHTQKMKDELIEDFGVREEAVTVIRHPVNNAFPDTDLTSAMAKTQLGISESEKAILFFGRIRPYKGLEYLLDAFRLLAASPDNYRLIVAGEPKKGSEDYLKEIRGTIDREFDFGKVILKVQFIPDGEMELFLKAADVLVLPYKEIFQSGVLFLSYSFGLPVVATDVGSFREEIIEGRTGFLCRPADPEDLAKTLRIYFESDLYKNLDERRQDIREYAYTHHSWDAVAKLTRNAYEELLGGVIRETFSIDSHSSV